VRLAGVGGGCGGGGGGGGPAVKRGAAAGSCHAPGGVRQQCRGGRREALPAAGGARSWWRQAGGGGGCLRQYQSLNPPERPPGHQPFRRHVIAGAVPRNERSCSRVQVRACRRVPRRTPRRARHEMAGVVARSAAKARRCACGLMEARVYDRTVPACSMYRRMSSAVCVCARCELVLIFACVAVVATPHPLPGWVCRCDPVPSVQGCEKRRRGTACRSCRHRCAAMCRG